MQVRTELIHKALIEDLLDHDASASERATARSFLLDYVFDPYKGFDGFQLLSRLERDCCDPEFVVPHGIRRSSLLVFSRYLRKLDVGCTLRTKEQTLDDFRSRQDSVLHWGGVPTDIMRGARRVCSLLLGDYVPDEVYEHPRFGPGVVAEGNFGLDKANLTISPELGRVLDPLGRLRHEFEASVKRTRVLVVPKDWRGGRVIGAEPVWQMAAQLSTKFVLEDKLGCVVPFTDQSKQYRLLRDHSLATIDLSNASDHVSVALVAELIPRVWFDHLMSIRTDSYAIGNQYGRTESFALMGNGFCFPMLSLVVFALAYAVIRKDRWGYLPTSVSEIVKDAKRWGVQTFGDDLVVPGVYFPSVVAALERSGLRCNHAKSFATPFFRETCGRYMFGEEGHSFRVPYLRCAEWSGRGVVTLRAHAAELEQLGYVKAARAVLASCPDIYRVDATRWRRNYQRLEHRTITFGSRKTRDVSLGDSTGWFHAFTTGIPEVENVGPEELFYGWCVAPSGV